MKYQLKPVTRENWKQVAHLTVAPHQTHLIETNWDSLLEATYVKEHDWLPIALYVDGQLVGFSMIGSSDKDKHSIWLDRFMIDQQYQNRGYGHALFKTVLNYLLQQHKAKKVYLRVHPENKKAYPFYESFGFTLLNDFNPVNGEKRMIYTV